MWIQLLFVGIVACMIVVGWRIVQRPDSGPATYWVAGWLAAGVGGLLGVLRQTFPWDDLLSYPLGSLFAALLLGGALVFAGRTVPRWFLPLAFVYGVLRGVCVVAGAPVVATLTGITLEPLAVLAAAWIVHRATPYEDAGRSQRWLAPSLALLAVFGAVHVLWSASATPFPPGLLAMWVVAVPPLFGLQLHAEWARGTRALQRAHDALEGRVAQRTAELARANASLQQENAERRGVEAALRESTERYQVLTELSSDLAFGFCIDPQTGITERWATGAFTRLTGYELAEMKDMNWDQLIHPDDREQARREFSLLLAGNEGEIENRIIAKSGEVLVVYAAFRVVRDPERGVIRVLGTARDVTEARRADEERLELERQVLEAERLESLALLTGGVAHDFNNLLAVILGNSRMALADAPPDSPLRSRLARIHDAAQLGAGLTEQMLAYSGKSGVTLKGLDLSHLLDEMTDLLRAAVCEGCRLELELLPRARVEGDATQLRQVVLNLVTNASEAGAGSVRVGTRLVEASAAELADGVGAEGLLPGTYVCLEVSDDGQGMDAATQSRIFEPFFTTKFSGRGLGLAGVLGIVRAHRGIVQVESRVAVGTRVRVLLPAPHSGLANVEEAPAMRAPEPRRGTILVVDDQDFVVEVAQAFLERAGHRVVTASGGRAAIECFRERAAEIDAVLLDLTMPDASGEVVLAELQRIRPDVRVIIATGYNPEAASRRLASHGVAGFVRKPYEPEEIVEQIGRALAERA